MSNGTALKIGYVVLYRRGSRKGDSGAWKIHWNYKVYATEKDAKDAIYNCIADCKIYSGYDYTYKPVYINKTSGELDYVIKHVREYD